MQENFSFIKIFLYIKIKTLNINKLKAIKLYKPFIKTHVAIFCYFSFTTTLLRD